MGNLKLVIGSKSGQMCNRLFAFSHFIANAIEYGYELHNPNFDDYCSYFKSTARDDFGSYPITVRDNEFSFFRRRKPADRIPVWANCLYLSPYHKVLASEEEYDLRGDNFSKLLDSNRIIVAYGWLFRDYYGFNKYAALLKKFFEPVEEYSERVAELIAPCRKRGSILVGVHIRRGDYKFFAGGRYYYDDSVYCSKMKQMKNLLNEQGKDVSFLICSNEENRGKFNGMDTFPGTGHFVEDLYSLSECDYLIGPPSTYSMWASFYGNVPLLHIKESAQNICLSDFSVIKV
jgi:Glycosyl transferase family 11